MNLNMNFILFKEYEFYVFYKNVGTNIGKMFLNVISTFHLIINCTNYLTKLQWKLGIVVGKISKPSKHATA